MHGRDQSERYSLLEHFADWSAEKCANRLRLLDRYFAHAHCAQPLDVVSLLRACCSVYFGGERFCCLFAQVQVNLFGVYWPTYVGHRTQLHSSIVDNPAVINWRRLNSLSRGKRRKTSHFWTPFGQLPRSKNGKIRDRKPF